MFSDVSPETGVVSKCGFTEFTLVRFFARMKPPVFFEGAYTKCEQDDNINWTHAQKEP